MLSGYLVSGHIGCFVNYLPAGLLNVAVDKSCISQSHTMWEKITVKLVPVFSVMASLLPLLQCAIRRHYSLDRQHELYRWFAFTTGLYGHYPDAVIVEPRCHQLYRYCLMNSSRMIGALSLNQGSCPLYGRKVTPDICTVGTQLGLIFIFCSLYRSYELSVKSVS